MPLSESAIRSKFVARVAARLYPHYELMRHEDRQSYGVPDISITGFGVTTWIETKLAKPSVKLRGRQHLRMTRLARLGRAWYLVWRVDENGQKTTNIVQPTQIETISWSGYNVAPIISTSGFNHNFVIDFIIRTHQGSQV